MPRRLPKSLRSGKNAAISPEAKVDIRGILRWSEAEFGKEAALRYQSLLIQAIRDVAASPGGRGVQTVEFANDVRLYPLRLSRERARTASGVVHNPRHVIVFRFREHAPAIEVIRILYDAYDIERRLPQEYRRGQPPEN